MNEENQKKYVTVESLQPLYEACNYIVHVHSFSEIVPAEKKKYLHALECLQNFVNQMNDEEQK